MGCAKPKRIRIPAVAGTVVTIEDGGIALFVKSGGMPGTRIYLDSRVETLEGDRSIEAVDGATVFQAFDKLIVQFPDLVLDPFYVLELELYPCMTPVRVIGHEAGQGALLKHQSNRTLAESETVIAFDEPAIADSGELEYGVWRFRRERWIGGAFSSDLAVTLRAWHKFYAYGAAQRALIAEIVANKADAEGQFGASLETGWKRDWATMGSNTQTWSHGPLLPWPRGGLQIELINPSAAATPTVHLIVYAKD